jgi:hypothetical protein
MQSFMIAAVIAIGGYWLLKNFASASPGQASGLMRKIGGVACIAIAGFLTLRGRLEVAAPLAIFGLGLLGASLPMPWNKKTPGQRSRVQTRYLAMELDHDSGRMDGVVLDGEFKGRQLSSLSEDEIKRLGALCVRAGDQSLALLEAWLDRAKPGWRERWAHASAERPQTSTAMSLEEALAILGLKPGTKAEDIRAAHRRLMKQFHPDSGGSDYLAVKINQAKERALRG